MTSNLSKELIQKTLKENKVSAASLGKLILLVEKGKISNNQAKGEVFYEMYKTSKDAETVIKENGLEQVSDTGAIASIALGVIEANPGPVADFKDGKEQALGFLVGRMMKKSKGQVNPKIANEVLRKLLQ